jgi:hypothetical protein
MVLMTKIEKIQLKKIIFFDKKIEIYLSLGLPKDVKATGEAFTP